MLTVRPNDRQAIRELLRAELRQPVGAEIRAAAAALRARRGPAVVGILLYGSCLREGYGEDRLIDFYLLVESYRQLYGRGLASLLNAVLPPNVYYEEASFEGRRVRAKCAVISLRDLARATSARALSPSFWGRFAQPCALVFRRDEGVEQALLDSLAAAVTTTLGATLPLMPQSFTSRELWVRALAQSYRTEFRAERAGRAQEIHDGAAPRYGRLAQLVLAGRAASDRDDPAPDRTRFRHDAGRGCRLAAGGLWRLRRLSGRTLQVLRLCKAAYTFTDGLDYILWKIEKHSGVRTEVAPWQRRLPLLAAPALAWRLYRRGAFR